MAFAAIFVPNFRLQAVVRCEPELAVRPIALIDGPPPTYQVVAVNRLAARLGVAEGGHAGRIGAELDRPGNLGGSDSWEDAESWRHSGSTPRSCVNAR